MRSFKHIAKVIKSKRSSESLQQTVVGEGLGYKAAGQFVSNVERGLCSIPIKKIKQFSTALKIDPQELIDAMVADYRDTLLDSVKTETNKENTVN